MKFLPRLSFRAWLIVPVLACGFIVGTSAVRVQQAIRVSELAGTPPSFDKASATGYAGGVRQLIVPGRDQISAQWIMQTQQMLAEGSVRVRHVGYDNAPQGRDVLSASAYRWWLGAMAWIDHAMSDRPLGISVERAALFADPVLHGLLLIGTVVFVARRFGALAAALLAAGLAAMFPLGGTFLAGQPAERGLVIGCALWSVLLLVAREAAGETERSARRRFFFAGVVGGLGLWLDVRTQAPILIGIGLGAVVAGWLAHRSRAIHPPAPWRMWAAGGAATTLAAYLVEYFPSHLGHWRPDAVQPLHALAWVAGGELLTQVLSTPKPGQSRWPRSKILVTTGVALLLAAFPIALWWQGSWRSLAPEPLAARLTRLPNGPVAASFAEWFSRDGFNVVILATCLPLVLLVPVVRLLVARQTDARDRWSLALAAGPVAVAIGFACVQLRWWNVVDATLLALLVATVTAAVRAARSPQITRWLWSSGFALVLAPGLLLLLPRAKSNGSDAVTTTEVEALVERDLAHWLTTRTGPGRATVLASPNLTTALIYHAGVRGIGTPYRENKDGLGTALRIASLTAQDEAMALVNRREITHIVLASWDPVLEEYAQLTSTKPETSLVGLLQRWTAPRWLRPVPYVLPNIPGFEQQSVKVFEVVELQDDATALSRLGECFLELRRADLAASVSEALERAFPSDLVALVSRAMIWNALGNTKGFATAFEPLPSLLGDGNDQDMLFDRRVGLAIVLAEGKRPDLAKEQVRLCLEEIDEERLRSLNTMSLYRLLVLSRVYGIGFPDQNLHTLALNLLPEEFRARLKQ